MVYTMIDRENGYESSQAYSRHKETRNGSNVHDFDAQVASQQARYNAEVERSMAREREAQRAGHATYTIPLTPVMPPPILYNDQRLGSVDRGHGIEREAGYGYRNFGSITNHTSTNIHDTTERTQQDLQARLDEEIQRRRIAEERANALLLEEEKRRAAEMTYQSYSSHQSQSAGFPSQNWSRSSPGLDRPYLTGLPMPPRADHYSSQQSISDPRTNPYSRKPSETQQTHTTDHHSRQPSIPERRPSSPAWADLYQSHNEAVGRKESSSSRHVPSQRQGSIPERKESSSTLPVIHGRQGSIPERKESSFQAPHPHHRHDSPAERKQSSSSLAAPHHRHGSIPERKESSSSAANAYQRHGSLTDRKGSSSSQSQKYHRSGSNASTRPSLSGSSSSRHAGLRKVKVTCDATTLNLSFDTHTTARDILQMSRERLGEGFDLKRYTLVESFKELGSERPLRCYERIRDVLTSWDGDEENELLIQPKHAQWEHETLDLENAPKVVPADMTASLYYSHRPESWHKWSFTLKADGQIIMQKYKGAEVKKICHLSDFDIYVPTAPQLKKLNAPRKFCFAIKSQQKSSMFENHTDFVHLFSTNDKEVASEWYRAVHSWRSYYLINVKGLNEAPPLPSKGSISGSISFQRNPSLQSQTSRKGSNDSQAHMHGYKSPSVSSRSGSRPFNIQEEPSVGYDRVLGSVSSRSGSVARDHSTSGDCLENARLTQPFSDDGLFSHAYVASPVNPTACRTRRSREHILEQPEHPLRKESSVSPLDFPPTNDQARQKYVAHKPSISSYSSHSSNSSSNSYNSHSRKVSTSTQASSVSSQSESRNPSSASQYRSKSQTSDIRKPSYGTTALPGIDAMSKDSTTSSMASMSWRFDPFTGKPLISEDSSRSDTLQNHSQWFRSAWNSGSEPNGAERSKAGHRQPSNDAYTGNLAASYQDDLGGNPF